MMAVNSGCSKGFALICLGDLVVYSCYCSPNTLCSMDEFSEFLDGLEVDIWARLPMNLVVAGDFNPKSRCWGSALNDRRTVLLEFMAGHVTDCGWETSAPLPHPLVPRHRASFTLPYVGSTVTCA